MPRKAVKRITAWSLSRFKTYDRCPQDAGYRYIERLPVPPIGKAGERGAKIHEEAHHYVIGEGRKLPESLGLFDEEFKELRKLYKKNSKRIICEEQWAFTKGWEETEWFAPDAWCRIKPDVVKIESCDTIATVIDHKTGRIRKNEHDDQLKLYALGTFFKFPKIEAVYPEIWYLDEGEIHGKEGDVTCYTRADDFEDLKKFWLKRIKKMLMDTRFAPNPGMHCKWCPFAKEKEGPCKHG